MFQPALDTLAAPPLPTEEQMVRFERWKRAREAAAQGDRPGLLEGIGRGALQGLTFGFGDEIVARVRSLWPETYSEAVTGEREAIELFRADHGIISGLSEIG